MSTKDVIAAAVKWALFDEAGRDQNAVEVAGDVLDALTAAGYAVVQLPEPTATEEDSDYGPTCVARWETIETGEVTAWPGHVVGIWDNHLDPDDARLFAAHVLAAVAAIERLRAETSPDGVAPVPASLNPPTPRTSAHSPHSGQEPTAGSEQ